MGTPLGDHSSLAIPAPEHNRRHPDAAPLLTPPIQFSLDEALPGPRRAFVFWARKTHPYFGLAEPCYPSRESKTLSSRPKQDGFMSCEVEGPLYFRRK